MKQKKGLKTYNRSDEHRKSMQAWLERKQEQGEDL